MTEPSDFTPYAQGRAAVQVVGLRSVGDERRRWPAGGIPRSVDGSGGSPSLRGRMVAKRGLAPGRRRSEELSLTGVVRDGDWVEVANRQAETGMFSVPAVTNLTTGLPVTVKGPRQLGLVLSLVMALVLLLVLIGFVGLIMMGLLSR